MVTGSTLFVPLGGLEEVGLNALLLESEADAVLVDCGLLFAPGTRGLARFAPDLSYLRDRWEKLRAVFLTHGHEDHVGALPWLLREFPVPVFGTPFTLALARRRVDEVLPGATVHFAPVSLGGVAQAGPFRAHFLRVTHSVPDAAALVVEAPGGVAAHTGDFKLDEAPVDGRLTDVEALGRWGERGIDLLCCDSTNAAVAGHTHSEAVVGRALRALVPEVEGRLYVVTFSSHAHRVQQVVEVAAETGRATTLAGRSLTSSAREARRLGHLRVPPGALLPEAHLPRLPRARQVVVLPGAQGEPEGSFHRLALGLDPRHRVLPGDHVALSARVIPGNEPAVHHLLDLCLRQGATVHEPGGRGLHASGHASAEDLVRVLGLLRPAHLLPVHGELRHRSALARLAADAGLAAERVFLGGNGQALRLEGGKVSTGPQVCAGRVPLERGEPLAPGDSLLRVRERLGAEGLALALVPLAADGSPHVGGLRVLLEAVVPAPRQGAAQEAAAEAVRRHLLGDGAGARGPAPVEAEAVRALRRHFRRLDWRPHLRVVVTGV